MKWGLRGILVAMLVLVLLAPAAAPLRLSYVYSDSMEPTIMTGDAYLVSSFGSAAVGDIVTFHTEEYGYVTHRIVGQTSEGFITKGDNNPSTDQAGGYDPVMEDAIMGKVVTVFGLPVVIPGLGTVIMAAQANLALTLGVIVVLVLASTVFSGGVGVDRPVILVKDVLVPLFAVFAVMSVLLLGFATIVEPVAFDVVPADRAVPGAMVVGQEHTETVTVAVSNLPGTQTVVSAEGMTVQDYRVNGSVMELDVVVPAQAASGVYAAEVTVRSYPALLPKSLLSALEAVHPVVAQLVSVGVVFAPLVAFCMCFFHGGEPLRFGGREKHVPVEGRP